MQWTDCKVVIVGAKRQPLPRSIRAPLRLQTVETAEVCRGGPISLINCLDRRLSKTYPGLFRQTCTRISLDKNDAPRCNQPLFRRRQCARTFPRPSHLPPPQNQPRHDAVRKIDDWEQVRLCPLPIDTGLISTIKFDSIRLDLGTELRDVKSEANPERRSIERGGLPSRASVVACN